MNEDTEDTEKKPAQSQEDQQQTQAQEKEAIGLPPTWMLP